MSLLGDVWRQEIAFFRQVVPIPVWRVVLGITFGGIAGKADHGWAYWVALVCAWLVTIGPWALAEARSGSGRST